MMGKSMQEQVEQARKEFPPGTRIRLIRMVPPEPQPVEPGTVRRWRSKRLGKLGQRQKWDRRNLRSR